MTKMTKATKTTRAVTADGDRVPRVLRPDEYPAEITASQGAHRPDIRFAAIHPLGLYYVDHQGAGHLASYFVPRRRGSRAKLIGGASSLRGALERVLAHEDEMIHPDAPREDGSRGPVSIYSLGRRLDARKTRSQLEDEIEGLLRPS